MGIMELWLPIVVSSVVVFFASSLAWMVLPHHKADIKVLPDEKGFLDHLKKFNVPPGTYMWPGCADAADMKSEEYKARYNAGPWGSINVLGGQPNFGKNLGLVFLVYVLIGVFTAYLTGQSRAAGADFAAVFQIAGAVAVLGYCAGGLPGGIFMGKPARFALTDAVDGLVYGLLTGLIFAWLWPAAENLIDLPT